MHYTCAVPCASRVCVFSGTGSHGQGHGVGTPGSTTLSRDAAELSEACNALRDVLHSQTRTLTQILGSSNSAPMSPCTGDSTGVESLRMCPSIAARDLLRRACECVAGFVSPVCWRA